MSLCVALSVYLAMYKTIARALVILRGIANIIMKEKRYWRRRLSPEK